MGLAFPLLYTYSSPAVDLLNGWTDIYGHGCFLPTSQPTFSYPSTFKFFTYSVCMLMCRAAGFTSYFLLPGQKMPPFWNCPAGNKSVHIKTCFKYLFRWDQNSRVTFVRAAWNYLLSSEPILELNKNISIEHSKKTITYIQDSSYLHHIFF